MRWLVLLVFGIVAVASCSDHDDFAPWELSCDESISLHGDPDETFIGYPTRDAAVEAWTLGSSGGPPQGEWVHFDGNRWILVDDNGSIVGRTEVIVWTGNAATTFTSERFASFDIEYCE